MVKISNTKETIIEKAVDLFLENGYDNSSLKTLANAVGIKAPAIYNHFENKEEILNEINRRAWAFFKTEVLDQLSDESDPEQKLKLLIHKLTKYLHGRRDFILVLDDSVRKPPLRVTTKKEKNVLNIVRGIVQDAIDSKGIKDPVDISVAAFSILAMTFWSHKWYNPKGKMSIEELSEYTSRLFLNGLFG